MLIGPHIHSPPIIPVFNSIAGILSDAEVLTDGRLHPPTGIGEDGALTYGRHAYEYIPLVEFYGSENGAERAYESFSRKMGMPEGSAENSPFLKQASTIRNLFDSKISDIARIFRRMRVSDPNVLTQLPEMASRADFFDRYTVGQLAHLLHFAEDDAMRSAIPLSKETLTELAIDIDYLSQLIEDDIYFTNAKSAELAFISGVIHWGVGSEGNAKEAAYSFSASSLYYSEAGNPVGAAIAAEAEAFINKYILRKPATENEAFAKAAKQWLKAARGIESKDMAGVYLCAYRGLLNSLLYTGGRSYETRLELESRLAFVNNTSGKHLEAAYDHIRRAFDLIKSFNGDSAGWVRIADSVRMAIGCFKKTPGCDGRIIRELEAVEAIARREACELAEDLDAVERKGGGERQSEGLPLMSFERGRVRLAHGDVIGGMMDLERAKNQDPGNAWYLSEVGLARHHLAYLVALFGDEKGAGYFLEGAQEYLEFAAEIALESGVWAPIFEARLGALAVSRGEFEEAVERLTRARKIDPKLKGLEEYLGIAQSQLEAERSNNVIRLRPVQ